MERAVARSKAKRKTKKMLSIWFLLAFAVIIFAVFQILNPLEANAPSGEETNAVATELKSKVSESSKQDLSDKIAEASILMYHHIGPLPNENDKIRYGLTVSEEDFDSQLKYLKENNFNVLTLGELESGIAKNTLLKRVVVLTFDDGYDDNFTFAKPILEKYGFRGTFFIISNKIGQAEYMNEEQIKELSQNNEIGSHSYSHPSMVRLSDFYLEREMKTSKKDLQALIGKTVTSFCYPAGKYNDKAVSKLQEYDYKIAVTTEASTGSFDISQKLLVPRYRIAPAISLETLIR